MTWVNQLLLIKMSVGRSVNNDVTYRDVILKDKFIIEMYGEITGLVLG